MKRSSQVPPPGGFFCHRRGKARDTREKNLNLWLRVSRPRDLARSVAKQLPVLAQVRVPTYALEAGDTTFGNVLER